MQRSSAMLRLPAHALVLALAALLLVAIGCTGAQAAPANEAPALSHAALYTAGSTPGAAGQGAVDQGAADPGAVDPAPSSQAPSNQAPATSRLTACVPGRDTARVEKNAVSAPTGLLQHSPAAASSKAGTRAWWDTDPSLLSGRIPEALTHLDLGIVRT